MSRISKMISIVALLAVLVTSIFAFSSCVFGKDNQGKNDPVVCKLTIDKAIENGKIAADKDSYLEGETVNLTITRHAGYELVSIKVNGEEKISEVSSDGKKLEFVITKDTSVSAEFAKIPTYKVDISASGGGNVASDKTLYLSGNNVVLTIAPSAFHRLKSLVVDGAEKIDQVTNKDGKLIYSFVITSNVSVVAEFEETPPEDLRVTVNSRVNIDGMELTLTDPDGNTQKVTVAEGTFTIPEAEQGAIYTVSGESRGLNITLGTILADGSSAEFNPASLMTDNSGTLNIAGGTYVVNPEYHSGINLIPVNPIEGDTYFVTRIQVSAEDMAALLGSNDEIVFGISLKSGDQTSVEHMIQLKPGANVSTVVCGCDAALGGSGVWEYDSQNKHLFFNDAKELTAYGKALVGDGLYFIVRHDANTGLTHTYWGTSLEDITELRSWGGGSGHSFAQGSAITGISIGYVHTTWGTQPPCKVIVSEVGCGTSLVDALYLPDVTLAEGNSFEHGNVFVEGSPYGDVTITFVPDEDYGVGSVTVNGVAMSLNAEGKLILQNYKQTTVDVTAVFNNNKFAITKTEGANISISVKDGNGNELDADALARVQFGTILTVEATCADGYLII